MNQKQTNNNYWLDSGFVVALPFCCICCWCCCWSWSWSPWWFIDDWDITPFEGWDCAFISVVASFNRWTSPVNASFRAATFDNNFIDKKCRRGRTHVKQIQKGFPFSTKRKRVIIRKAYINCNTKQRMDDCSETYSSSQEDFTIIWRNKDQVKALTKSKL